MSAIGAPLERRDGLAKITGVARYAGDHPAVGVLHGVIVGATIAFGRVAGIDARAALGLAGVVDVITHQSGLTLARPRGGGDPGMLMYRGGLGEDALPLQDNLVRYDGAVIALVLADTLEEARHGASLVAVSYEERPHRTEFAAAAPAARELREIFGVPYPIRRGRETSDALADAPVRIAATYTTPVEHHHPIEPLATLAAWEGEQLTIHDSTQGVMLARTMVADTLGINPEHVRVLAGHVGGGFGAKGRVWWPTVLAAAAARRHGRPVKLILTRRQMFSLAGRRPATRQQVELGATRGGRLLAIRHDVLSETSRVREYVESAGGVTRAVYACPSLEVRHRLAQLDLSTPQFMRTPGEAPGLFALESAIDELAHELTIDPLELRLRNHADHDPHSGLPWSSKHLRECYEMGAAAIGWGTRARAPATRREGDELVGLGMATAVFRENATAAAARVRIATDGRAVVSTAATDIGTGTRTVMAQVAADALGVPVGAVTVELGDSSLPPCPGAVGSRTAANVGAAVFLAARRAREALVGLAVADKRSPLFGAAAAAVVARNGEIMWEGPQPRREPHGAVLSRAGREYLEADAVWDPVVAPARAGHAFYSFGAVFAEVRVDADLGTVRVARMRGVYDVGRVLNAATMRSQLIGGLVFGVGMALLEESLVDPASGRWATRNLADYRVAVNADVPDIDAVALDRPDPLINELGVRGGGEIANAGTAAAIANAVFNATGRRVRDLPIVAEKLLGS